MIYTSYFANWRKLKQAGIQIVSIARINPNSDIQETLMELAPSVNLLMGAKKGIIKWDRYVEKYNKQLAQIDLLSILQKLEKLQEKYGNIALCCYEKSNENCHRRLLAEFLNQNLNLKIEEYQ